MKVNTVPTNGSLENLALLRAGKADFGLYQTWSAEIISEFDEDFLREAGFTSQEQGVGSVQFVANMYSQPAHFIVRQDAGITSPADLGGKTVSLGLRRSGDYAMSLVLLDHFGLTEAAINARYLNYTGTCINTLFGSPSTVFLEMVFAGDLSQFQPPFRLEPLP